MRRWLPLVLLLACCGGCPEPPPAQDGGADALVCNGGRQCGQNADCGETQVCAGGCCVTP